MNKTTQTPLAHTARLLDLVPYISSHQGIELGLLAQNFGVTQGQMIADLTSLWMCGLPGYTHLELMDLSFDSGFVTIHNAQTLSHPRTLSDEETIALLLGLDLVIKSLPDNRGDLKESAATLVEKLSKPGSLPAILSASPTVEGSVRSLIDSALLRDGAVKLTYHSFYSDVVSNRIVIPIEIRQEGGFEYLWAMCQSAHALRIFRLDRIQSLESTTRPAPSQVDSTSKIQAPTSYIIRTHSRAREVMERFSLKRDSMEHDASTTSYSLEWIRRSVLASSGSVELVSPPNIRSEILTAAKAMLDCYKEK